MNVAARQALDADHAAASDHNGWHVYRMNDYEWWLARTLEEAKADAARCWGYTLEQAEAEEMFDEPHELDAGELDRLTFVDDTQLPEGALVRRSFREELEMRVASLREKGGEMRPERFAVTDW